MAVSNEQGKQPFQCPFCDCQLSDKAKNSEDLRLLTRLRLTVPVKCPMVGKGCSWEGDISQFWEHLSGCGFFPRPCPYNCDPNIFMPKELLRVHLQEKCPMKTVSCEYNWAGCTVVLNRKGMQAHMKESIVLHNELLAKTAKSYRHQVSQLQAEINHLREVGSKTSSAPANPQTAAVVNSEPISSDYSPAKKRRVTFSQSTDIIDNGAPRDPVAAAPVRKQEENVAAQNPAGILVMATVPDNAEPLDESWMRRSSNQELEPITSPIVAYASDLEKEGKICPSSVCHYAKSDRRTVMVFCQSCGNWYHSMCINVVNRKARYMTDFKCSVCRQS